MKFEVLRVEPPFYLNYPGLNKVGGEGKLFKETVGAGFTDWERYYDKRQSAILDEKPGLFDGRDRSVQLRLLCDDFGMRPEHRYLDYGCATVAAGQHAIRFLEAGNYVGMDVSASAIAIGRKRIEGTDLKDKRPQLFHVEDGRFPETEFEPFDYAAAFSVFTHCPPNVTIGILKYIKSVLKPGGTFVASCGIVERYIVFQGFHNFYYPAAFFEEVCAKLDLDLEILPDPISIAVKRDPRLLGDCMNVVVRRKG